MNPRFLRVLTLAVLTLAPGALAFPQSLAAAAKKEQARRKEVPPKAGAKVYTESDISGSAKGTAAKSDDAADANKAGTTTAASPSGASSAAPKGAAGSSAADATEQQAEAYKARIAALKEAIADRDEEVRRLANHPTGGGKVCRIPEGVFQPGKTAPEQVVCPYQMESRHDRAKREQDRLKADLVALEAEARRSGVVIR